MVDAYTLTVDVVIPLVVALIVFYLAVRPSIEKAISAYLKAHPNDQFGAFVAGINALLKYIQDHPVEDKQLMALILALVHMAGIDIPAGVLNATTS